MIYTGGNMEAQAVEVLANRSRRLVSAVIRQAVEDHFRTVDRLLKKASPAEAEMIVVDSVSLLESERARLVVLLHDQPAIDEASRAASEKLAIAKRKLAAYSGESHAESGRLKYVVGKALDVRRDAKDAELRLRAKIKVCAQNVLELEDQFDASAWILSDDESPGSFVWCCEIANLSPRMFRARMFNRDVVSKARAVLNAQPKHEDLAYSVH